MAKRGVDAEEEAVKRPKKDTQCFVCKKDFLRSELTDAMDASGEFVLTCDSTECFKTCDVCSEFKIPDAMSSEKLCKTCAAAADSSDSEIHLWRCRCGKPGVWRLDFNKAGVTRYFRGCGPVMYCEEHFAERGTVPCARCEDHYHPKDLKEGVCDQDYWCEKCSSWLPNSCEHDCIVVCPRCEDVLDESTAEVEEGIKVCSHCWTLCDGPCCRIHYSDEMIESDNGYYCKACVSKPDFCHNCSFSFAAADLNKFDGVYYCKRCSVCAVCKCLLKDSVCVSLVKGKGICCNSCWYVCEGSCSEHFVMEDMIEVDGLLYCKDCVPR